MSDFYRACVSGDLATVKRLQSEGQDINQPDSDYDNRSPLMAALVHKNTEVTDYLLGLPNINIDYSDDINCTALHLACEYDASAATLGRIVNRMSDACLNSKSRVGGTALDCAVWEGNSDAVAFLSTVDRVEWDTEHLLWEAR